MGNFTFEKCGGIEGLYLIHPKVFGDNRGYFMETYNYNAFKEAGLDMVFVQDNQSSSTKGVLRGLHYQKNHTQGKLVRVLSGEVFDVAVDIRRGSKTYGKWFGVTLTAEKKNMFYIPEGFAHGFLVLSDIAEFCYGMMKPLVLSGRFRKGLFRIFLRRMESILHFQKILHWIINKKEINRVSGIFCAGDFFFTEKISGTFYVSLCST